MTLSSLRPAPLLLSLFCLVSTNSLAQSSETSVKMKDLPPAVQSTVRQQSRGARIRGLSKEVENGRTFYEAELKVSGRNKDVIIDPTGAVVTIEEEISLAAVPAAARAEIEKHVANGKVRMIESVTENGGIVAYEAHIRIGSKSKEVKVAPDGRLIETEDSDDDEDEKPAGKKYQPTKRP